MEKWLARQKEWLLDSGISDEDKVLIDKMTEEETKDNFYQELEFGTAGIRGIRGLGTGRINRYLIRKVTQGYCSFLLETVPDAREKGVAIAYDTRHKSDEFALEAAKVFSGNKIKVHMYDRIRSTPELSFAIRELGAAGGLVLTASHNPPEYNGYKVYNKKGCQLSTEETRFLVEKIDRISSFSDVRLDEKMSTMDYIKDEVEDIYVEKVKSLSLEDFNKELRIAYTPLHGTGLKTFKRILDEKGACYTLVEEQCVPDGDFPTALKPNPEEKEALVKVIEKGREFNADLLLATDPDADRLGVMSLQGGEYVYLTGNQVGALLIDYILSRNKLEKDKSFVVTSIVTSRLGARIAASYGAETLVTFTGFKNLGKKMDEIITAGGRPYFVYEESIGYLPEDFIRDKDGISAAYLIAEMAGVLKKEGLSLCDKLEQIYKRHGYHQERQISFVIPGIEGIGKIKGIMKDLRDNGPGEFGEVMKLESVTDYLEKKVDGEHTDLLYYEFTDSSWVGVRPSGTEPKLKLYINVIGNSKEECEVKMDSLESWFRNRAALWL